MSKKKLIFIYPKLYTFIQTEIKALSSEFELITIDQDWLNRLLLPFTFIQQFVFLLFNISKVDTILVSFGGYLSFFPALFGKVFRKKVAIIVHGTDCVDFSEINYGNLRIPLMKWFIEKSYQLANVILPVSESLVYTENNYYSVKTLKFGYSHHLKDIKTPYQVIPNGLIIEDWQVENITKKENTFITVMTSDQTERKGANLIVEVARKLPKFSFYFAGTENIVGGNFLPENVICLGKLSPNELRDYYSKTQFYLQLSNFEGFGVALCEAMLCECIPIVSDVNYLPSIVGDSGFVLNKRNVEMLIDLMHEVLKSDINNFGQKARKRIIENFSIENRQELLISTLKSF